MSARKNLGKKQLAVIDDLFGSQLDEQAILDKHKVSRGVYNKWLADEDFTAEFACRITGARLQSQAVIARYSLVAAAKLVQLTESGTDETARKACLDIISLPFSAEKKTGLPNKLQQNNAGDKQVGQLSSETASKLLEILADGKKNEKQ